MYKIIQINVKCESNKKETKKTNLKGRKIRWRMSKNYDVISYLCNSKNIVLFTVFFFCFSVFDETKIKVNFCIVDRLSHALSVIWRLMPIQCDSHLMEKNFFLPASPHKKKKTQNITVFYVHKNKKWKLLSYIVHVMEVCQDEL